MLPRQYTLITLGSIVGLLGLVVVLCAVLTAGNVADMETFAAKYGDGTLPWLVGAALSGCLLVALGLAVGIVGGVGFRRSGPEPRARRYAVASLGVVVATLGFVVGLCSFATAMNVGDMETFAAKYGDGTQPALATAAVCSLLLLPTGVAVAVVSSVGSPRTATAGV